MGHTYGNSCQGDVPAARKIIDMTPRIYMAGPISGLTFDVANDWREKVRLALLPDIEAANPLRGKGSLVGYAELTDGYTHDPLVTDRAIFARDYQDVLRADLLFVNLLGAKRVSQGTNYEIAWAYQLRKPILVAIEESGNVHDHPFLRQVVDFWTDNLPDACDAIRGILLA